MKCVFWQTIDSVIRPHMNEEKPSQFMKVSKRLNALKLRKNYSDNNLLH